MKKIMLFLCLLFLAGCGHKSVQNRCKIILNIDSEVDPIITVSSGRGKYNPETKQYILETKDASPIDISLTYPDYESVNLFFSSGDLMTGLVERDITFGTEKMAKIKLSIITTASVWDISAQGINFKRSLKTFTGMTKCSESVDITVSGGEDYRDVKLTVTPEQLVTGLFTKDIILVRQDEAIIYFNNNQGIIVNDYETGQRYRLNQYDDGFYCIVKKNAGIVITDNQKVSYYQVKNDIKYDNPKVNHDLIIKYNLNVSTIGYITNPQNFLYYVQDQKLVQASSTYGVKQLNLPAGTQLIYIYPNLDGTYSYCYHLGYEAYGSTIDINQQEFTSPQPLSYKARFYNRVSTKYLSEVNINGKVYTASDDDYFTMTTFHVLDDYYHETFSPSTLKMINGEFFLESVVTPKEANYIINFVDQNNKSLDIEAMNGEYDKLEKGRYLIYGLDNYNQSNLAFYDVNRSFKLRVKANNHWISLTKPIYAEMFTEIFMNGKPCYELLKPIMVDVESYELRVGLINNYGNDYIVHNGKIYSGDNQIWVFKVSGVRVNDVITIVLQRNNKTNKYDVVCKKADLEKGLIVFDTGALQLVNLRTHTISLSSKYQFTNRTYNIYYGDNAYAGALTIIDDNTAIIPVYSTVKLTIIYIDKETGRVINNTISLISGSNTYQIN